MIHKLLLSFLFISLMATVQASGNVEEDLGGFESDAFERTLSEDLEGFSEETLTGLEKSNIKSTQTEANVVLSGDLSFKTSVGYKSHRVDGSSYFGVNQARTALYLQLDGKLSDAWKMRISGDAFYDAIYDLRSNNHYRQEVLDDYRTQLRVDESYLQGKLSSQLDLKAGRQIVVWGKSDTIRITDVINPLDNRLPGMTDIEDLRLSVAMAKLDYYCNQWNVSAMIIPENRIMQEATPRGEFFPVDEILIGAPDPFLALQKPATSWDNMQYAFAANGLFSGWDLSFYAANVLDQKWHFDQLQGSVPMGSLHRVVSKIKMLGCAVNFVEGSWLYKAEAAFLNEVGYNTTADTKNRLDTLIGVEYTGFTESVVSLELANRHIFDHEEQMARQADYVDKNEVQSALRLTRSFMHDRLNVTGLLSLFGSEGEKGGFARISAEYEIMDALSASVGIVDYRGGDKPFMDAIRDNDRIFADIKYSF